MCLTRACLAEILSTLRHQPDYTLFCSALHHPNSAWISFGGRNNHFWCSNQSFPKRDVKLLSHNVNQSRHLYSSNTILVAILTSLLDMQIPATHGAHSMRDSNSVVACKGPVFVCALFTHQCLENEFFELHCCKNISLFHDLDLPHTRSRSNFIFPKASRMTLTLSPQGQGHHLLTMLKSSNYGAMSFVNCNQRSHSHVVTGSLLFCASKVKVTLLIVSMSYEPAP